MSTGFPCPRCQHQLGYDPRLAGQRVACPVCHFAFVMPGPEAVGAAGHAPQASIPTAAPVAPPPPQESVVPGGPAAAVATTPSFRKLVSTAIERRFEPSTSWLDLLFDFQFKKYLTPLIIRVCWAICVVLAVTCVFVSGGLAAYESMPSEGIYAWLMELQDPSPADAPRVEPGSARPPQGKFEIEFGPPPADMGDDLKRAAWAVLKFFISLLGIVYSLMFLRVWFETLIVIFNIAESLASIDRKTRPA